MYGDFICQACQRDFRDREALLQHYRYAGAHAAQWCERCTRLFPSPLAIHQHLSNSGAHFLCHLCPEVDCRSRDMLADHCWIAHGSCCLDCMEHVPVSERRRERHREVRHRECADCGKACGNENNLLQHKKVHLPVSKACASCLEGFTSTSAVLLHQESGGCRSGMTAAVVRQLVWICITSMVAAEQPYEDYPCHECPLRFNCLSALVQHCENTGCGEVMQRHTWVATPCRLLVRDRPIA